MHVSRTMKTCLLIITIACIFTLCFCFVSCNTENSNNPVNPTASPTEGPKDPRSFSIKALSSESYPEATGSNLASSLAYANGIANKVQGFYTNSKRDYYALVNTHMSLVHKLSGGTLSVTDIANKDGVSYAHDTLDVYIELEDGSKYYSGNSSSAGRMNTVKLGYYYYETHIRDLGFAQETFDGNKYEFTSDVSLSEGWKANHMSAPEYNESGVSFEVVETLDPYCHISGLNITGSQVNAIEVTINATGSGSNVELFIYTNVTKSFNGNQRTVFTVDADGEDHTYLIDISSLKGKNDDLCGIRFDFGAMTGDKLTIKSLKAVKTAGTAIGYKLDKTYHVYPDKLHQEYELVKIKSTDGVTEYKNFGVELKIPMENVVEYTISKNANSQPEYVAAIVKNVGVIGFIIPNNGVNYQVTATQEGDNLVIREYIPYDKNNKTVASRLYNDESNSFDGIKAAAEIERNPLTDLSVKYTVKERASYVAYDAISGSYQFKMKGIDFNAAYRNPNNYYKADITINNTANSERSIYVWMNSSSGSLEGAQIVDNNGIAMPLPVQVSKNFAGEVEEPFYDPSDKEYGDTFVPIKIKAGEKVEYSLYHLYQNWGKFPLKQISSIQFHISYYHLSTGVTESNCIAPYYVFGRDLWTLPDFRGCSGIMWASQPQYNSVGRLRFVSYTKDDKVYASEYTESKIHSSGNTYADINYNYISDCGSFKYDLRHVEFPQNDENRTYYTMELEFLKDLTIEDVKNNLTLFSFDGRYEPFNLLGYSDENGNIKNDTVNKTDGAFRIIDIGGVNPYFTYYGLDNAKTEIMNFAFIMINYDITIGGNKWNGHFALRDSYAGDLNYGELSLMEDTVNFKKGDKIYLDFILLPWGTGTETTDNNVQKVRNDSVFNKITLTATKGTVQADTFLPIIKAENNTAEFVVQGGRNLFAINVSGITSFQGISISEKLSDGTWVAYETGTTDVDGYQISYNQDGTYTYSFIVDMGENGNSRTFKVSCK